LKNTPKSGHAHAICDISRLKRQQTYHASRYILRSDSNISHSISNVYISFERKKKRTERKQGKDRRRGALREKV
jgi:hypothetical protein